MAWSESGELGGPIPGGKALGAGVPRNPCPSEPKGRAAPAGRLAAGRRVSLSVTLSPTKEDYANKHITTVLHTEELVSSPGRSLWQHQTTFRTRTLPVV